MLAAMVEEALIVVLLLERFDFALDKVVDALDVVFQLGGDLELKREGQRRYTMVRLLGTYTFMLGIRSLLSGDASK